MAREQRLASTFVELADSLVDDFDVVDLLTLLAGRCVELFDASAAGILLGDADGTLRPVAATSGAVEVVEIFQSQADEGPCRDCFVTGTQVTSGDLAAAADRWPRFAAVAVAAGFRSADAVPLRLRGQVLGALNLLRTEPAPLSDDQVATAQALADVATIAILQNQAISDSRTLTGQLQRALTSRIAIEQAKGVIAEHLGIDIDQAFAGLRQYARSNNRRLTDVAEDVISGALPPTWIRMTPPASDMRG